MGQSTHKALWLLAVFAAVWAAARYLLPLFAPFLLGAGLALAAEPMTRFLHRRLRLPRGVSAGIGVCTAFCLLALAVLAGCAFLVRELGVLARVLPDMEDTARSALELLRSWLLEVSGHAPRSLQPLLRQNVTDLFSDGSALLDRGMRYGLGLAGDLLSHIPDQALSLGTAVLAGCMISAKLPELRAWAARRLPRERFSGALEALKRVRQAAVGWLVAQCKLMGLSFVVVLLGLVVLRVPFAPFWALGIAAVDALPVLGTGTVLLPWALVCLLQADGARAAGLVGIYIAASVLRSALEPRLVGRQLGLDPLATLMALYAGYRLWGLAGMLLSPLLAVSVMQLLPGRTEG